jgi:hypothetical protein
MKTPLLLLLFASLPLVAITPTTPAHADDKAACLDASLKGQTFRNANKLLEARDQFRVCAQVQCPGVVQTDCVTWLDAVEKSLPTVVVTAKDAAGAPLLEVAVTVDGAPLTTSLDGRAIPMNPGAHAFHFERADGSAQDLEVVVSQGVQNQAVTAVLKPAVVVAPPPPPQAARPEPSLPSTPPAAASPDSGPWKTVGWIVGGVGVAGLGLGTIFGIVAIGDKSSAHCADSQCDAGPLDSARNAARVSDIGLIAGGVLFAGGAALVLLAPGGGHAPSGGLTVAPMVGANDGGVVLGGRW